MDGKLTINKISNCEGLTIKMDDAKIIGDYSSLEINDVRDSKNTSISMRNTQVMTHEEYQRSQGKPGYSGYRSRGAGGGGTLTVNRVVDCEDTKIDQDKMRITGNFDEVTMNEIVRSKKTDISMVGTTVNNGGSDDSDSDDSDDSSDNGHTSPFHPTGDKAPARAMAERAYNDFSHLPRDEVDSDGLPLPSTYAYHMAEKFTFNVRLGAGANVTCTFLQADKVRTVKSFLVELQPHFKNKSFRLQILENDEYIDSNPEQTLKEAGFQEKIGLRTVIVSPESDY